MGGSQTHDLQIYSTMHRPLYTKGPVIYGQGDMACMKPYKISGLFVGQN